MSKFTNVFNTSAYRKYMDKQKKEKKKLQSKHYSSFWWDDTWADSSSRFAGLSKERSSSSDVVKLIKLTGYQRAIANFVKIVTKKDVPVVFSGNESFTNGKRVNLSTDITDKNFDVSVGLALHEGSHIILTDFKYVQDYLISEYDADYKKQLINILEDRRIDSYVFKTSPGYRAYYHKMYDHYFNGAIVGKGLRSAKLRKPGQKALYLFHLANMTNPFFDKKALPGLAEIIDLIDIKNISRLTTTQEVVELSKQVYDIIIKHTLKDDSGVSNDGTSDDITQQQPGQSTSNETSPDSSNSESENAGSDGENDDEGNEQLEELTYKEELDLQKAWDKQKAFINGDVQKKRANKKLQSQLEQVSQMQLDLQMVGGDGVGTFQTIIYDFVHRAYVKNILSLYREYKDTRNLSKEDKDAYTKQFEKICNTRVTPYYISAENVGLPLFLDGEYREEVAKGMELGSILGRKLQVRNEERSLVYNRLNTGHIDNKRLSHAGYGIETIFKQIHIDKYKQACLHISLDLSASMNGRKWDETVIMTSAIAKAATYVQNLRIQVSLRTTEASGRRSELPCLINMYDSKYNDLHHFRLFMSSLRPWGCTPEGLCFEAMLKRNMLLSSNNEQTSYFLNISDGEPGMDNYGGNSSLLHTARQVKNMINNYGISVLSFFVEGSNRTNTVSQAFTTMYGKDARCVSAQNMHQIARELNGKFLEEGKYTG